MQILNEQQILEHFKSHQSIFIHSGVSAPQTLIKLFVQKLEDLKQVKVYQIHTEGDCSYALKKYKDNVEVNCFFNGQNIRKIKNNINENYIPIFLSEVPLLFYNKIIQLDVALVQVSPPDDHGMVSLGPSVDVALSAVRTAKIVIAQINPQMPRTFGDGQLHKSKIHFGLEVNEPLHQVQQKKLSDTEVRIGQNIAELIEDGSTLQMGIGAIPDAALMNLKNHKKLGIHTEMFSDGLIDLYESGAITGEFKKKHPYKIVSSFVIGSQRVYDFIHNNPEVLLLDAAYTNNTHIIAQNPKVVAINSAIEVDLTGQVCADSIGSRIYSGIGGQMDFIRGAALSPQGKPIIALPSVTKNGVSKINLFLKSGAGVVTTRAHAHYIVTEYGVAYLYGKNLRSRARALIQIAHPDHRARLEEEAAEQLFKDSSEV